MAHQILVVDDDNALLETLRDLLELHGYAVEGATNGVLAKRYIRSKTFDLVLTDIMMPDISGLSIIQAVRDSQPQCRIMAMTGLDLPCQNVPSKSYGADFMVPKPIHWPSFLPAVAKLLQVPVARCGATRRASV
jgi:DNA-binding response OmpR family regulator